MSDLRHRPASNHYPAPQNHITRDPTPLDQAIYVPSVSPGYAMAAHAQNWQRPLPRNVGSGDLNFLDPANPLFCLSHAMSSAGQALNQRHPCIITQRNPKETMLICDSGGYQIARGHLPINGDADRLRILRWMEQHADIAMTLDVPTWPVGRDPAYAFTSFADCLTATLEHLDYFAKHRVAGKVRMLNVLQGNTLGESDMWYDAVKHYPFEGWAFAGPLRLDIFAFCRRLLIMADEGLLRDRKWLHVLGTARLDTAVLLTAVQRAVNRHINPHLRISFDTASAFLSLSFNNVYTLPAFGRYQMSMGDAKLLDGARYVGSSVRWPWPSPLGDLMTMGDLCVPKPPTTSSYRDTQSNHYVAHHNLAALCWAVALGNRVFDSDSVMATHSIAPDVSAAVQAIDQVFASGTMARLNNYSVTFGQLRQSQVVNGGEEHRLG